MINDIEKAHRKLKQVDSEIKINSFIVIIPFGYLFILGCIGKGWIILSIESIIAIAVIIIGISRAFYLISKRRELLIDCGLTETDYNKLNPPIIDLQAHLENKWWYKTTWGKILIVFGILILIFLVVMIFIALFKYNYI
jgi:uncharacterized membrane protein